MGFCAPWFVLPPIGHTEQLGPGIVDESARISGQHRFRYPDVGDGRHVDTPHAGVANSFCRDDCPESDPSIE